MTSSAWLLGGMEEMKEKEDKREREREREEEEKYASTCKVVERIEFEKQSIFFCFFCLVFFFRLYPPIIYQELIFHQSIQIISGKSPTLYRDTREYSSLQLPAVIKVKVGQIRYLTLPNKIRILYFKVLYFTSKMKLIDEIKVR